MNMHLRIDNYYETLLEQAINEQKIGQRYDPGTLADFRCTVLNQLPAKYIRSQVDLAFFQSPQEAQETHRLLVAAIDKAHQLIALRGNS